MSATERSAPGSGEQHPVIGWEFFRSQDKHSARLAKKRAGNAALEVGPEPVTSIAWPLIHDDKVQVYAAASSIGVPLHELADEGLVVRHGDPDQHDRKVAGDAMRPQARLPEAIGGDGIRLP